MLFLPGLKRSLRIVASRHHRGGFGGRGASTALGALLETEVEKVKMNLAACRRTP